jgi:poly-beta-1,6-N-acetyl-D-glucosamine biosynthesis protein PgaD
MDHSFRSWPPIIVDAHVPRAIVWRDRLMTIGMWLLLVFLMRHGLQLIWDEANELLGLERYGPQANWDIWWARLHPYLITAGVLGIWLFCWGLISLWRIRHHTGKPQPPALTLAEEAKRIGCTESELMAWRSARVATVHIDDNGHIDVVVK